jgi:hypothetical protein
MTRATSALLQKAFEILLAVVASAFAVLAGFSITVFAFAVGYRLAPPPYSDSVWYAVWAILVAAVLVMVVIEVWRRLTELIRSVWRATRF